MHNPHSRNLVKRLTSEAIQRRVGVGASAVVIAAREGMSPHWYRTIWNMCVERAEPCPMDAFNFREDFNKSTPEQTASHNEGAEL